jgi:hypothetical protein
MALFGSEQHFSVKQNEKQRLPWIFNRYLPSECYLTIIINSSNTLSIALVFSRKQNIFMHRTISWRRSRVHYTAKKHWYIWYMISLRYKTVTHKLWFKTTCEDTNKRGQYTWPSAHKPRSFLSIGLHHRISALRPFWSFCNCCLSQTPRP